MTVPDCFLGFLISQWLMSWPIRLGINCVLVVFFFVEIKRIALLVALFA